MRREWLLSVGGVALAFLGTQHHNLMMVLFAVGLSDVGMSLMTKMPLVRDAMLLMSLVIAAAIAYQISRPRRPLAMRITGGLSIVLTLGLAGWSLMHFGL
jgi:sorbitol-specific phosphotransferase system component IIBC